MACDHKMCLECILIGMPDEETEITCIKCNSRQKIKNENSQKYINIGRRERKDRIPKLKCKNDEK